MRVAQRAVEVDLGPLFLEGLVHEVHPVLRYRRDCGIRVEQHPRALVAVVDAVTGEGRALAVLRGNQFGAVSRAGISHCL